MKEEVFFGKEGLTSTQANFVANQAKEYIKEVEAELATITFFNTTMGLIGTDRTVISTGTCSINNIKDKINICYEAKKLIAWLREAIKARTALVDAVRKLEIEEWANMNNITLPKSPSQEHALTEDEYLSNLNIKERNEYYMLETKVTNLGKFIHPNGVINNARACLVEKINHPIKVSENGRDTIIYEYIPTVNLEDVNNLFFELQQEHRNAQARLNGLKFKMDKAIEESALIVSRKYQEEYSIYNTQMTNYFSQFSTYKKEKLQEIQELKIILPNDLQSIYDKIVNLGK